MDERRDHSINTEGDRASYITTNETTPLQSDKKVGDGFKIVVVTFAIITIIISIGLAISISQQTKKIPLGSTVVSDRPLCTNVGHQIFLNGGNAVDVAIAVTFCLGVILPHLTGIGGNGLILIYNHKLGKPIMCVDSWSESRSEPPKLLSAMFLAHTNAGKKPWKDLLEPSIAIAKEGFLISESLVESKRHLNLNAGQALKTWLSSLKIGMNVTSPGLASTLSAIQKEGQDALYTGSLATTLSQYFNASTLTDIKLNKSPCTEITFDGFKIFTSGAMSGGPFLSETLIKSKPSRNSTLQDLIDHLQGKDEITSPFPSGVVVNAVDENDNYISIVSGLGTVLGSQNLVKDGYIIGITADPQKSTKMSSIGSAFIATEITDPCAKRLIGGGVDARDLLQVIPGLLWGDTDIQSVIEAARARISSDILLAEANHAPSLPFPLPPASFPYPAINVIEKYGDTSTPYPDSRGRDLSK